MSITSPSVKAQTRNFIRPNKHSSVFTNSEIYTLGYARWAVEDVKKQLQTLEATLVDVRHSPHTSKPGFSRDDLSARFGDRYLHVPAFGNVNYKDGPIEIARPEQGIEKMQGLERSPILMCGCQSPRTCHRSVIAELLADRTGASITHLRSPSERAEPTLFGD